MDLLKRAADEGCVLTANLPNNGKYQGSESPQASDFVNRDWKTLSQFCNEKIKIIVDWVNETPNFRSFSCWDFIEKEPEMQILEQHRRATNEEIFDNEFCAGMAYVFLNTKQQPWKFNAHMVLEGRRSSEYLRML